MALRNLAAIQWLPGSEAAVESPDGFFNGRHRWLVSRRLVGLHSTSEPHVPFNPHIPCAGRRDDRHWFGLPVAKQLAYLVGASSA